MEKSAPAMIRYIKLGEPNVSLFAAAVFIFAFELATRAQVTY
jgi:hypothetical protein